MAERERDMKTYVLYNPKAGSGAGRDAAMKLRAVCAEELEFRDITAIESYADFFDRIGPSAKVIHAQSLSERHGGGDAPQSDLLLRRRRRERFSA